MRRWLLFMLICAVWSVVAAPLPRDDAQRACWQRYTRERTRINLNEPKAVDFSNLRTGYTVQSPFLVEFAVRGLGVAPAGKPMEGTGHHHILIDTRLPSTVTGKIPFSDTHRHFGKGQTFTVLDLSPGSHTLRLLFADYDHRPYFVFSPEIVVNIAGRRGNQVPTIDPQNLEASCAAWYQHELTQPHSTDDAIYVANLRDDEPVISPLNLRLGVVGWGVAAKGVVGERNGYFTAELFRDGKLVQTIDLSNGATQAHLFVTPATYRLRVRFFESSTGKEAVPAYEMNLPVAAQERI
jgi:hypothetical protein